MTGTNGQGDGDEWMDRHNQPLETERLALDDADERLPWLENDDDDDEADYHGSDFGQTLRLGLMALAALAAIVLGIYWATHRSGDDAAKPDGSVVAAESQPYKEAPKNPGGKTFEGTGDTSFAVSEGQSKPAQMSGSANGAAAPAASDKPAAGGAPAPAGHAAPAAAAPASGGVGVQVGAFSSKDTAESGWSKLVSASHGVLSGVSHRVVEGTADNGTIYRLQALAPSGEAAQALCGKLKNAGISCQVK